MKIETHADVIRLFGSGPALARAIGEKPGRACHWSSRGIPAKYWPAVEQACAERGEQISASLLAQMPRQDAQPEQAAA